MRAWRFIDTSTPLTLTEVDEPIVPEGWVLLEVRATGLCHSDLGVLHGEIDSMLSFRPITLGHEFSGVISVLGPGTTGFAVGDAVGNGPISGTAAGIHFDGGHAERVAVPASCLVPIPDGVSFEQAAAATDAGATAYNAVHGAGHIRPGMSVGIIGLGSVGMVGARLAVLAGADVYAVDLNPAVLPQALAQGVLEVGDDIRAFADRDLDVVIDFAGFGATTQQAIEAVRKGGRVVQIGLGRAEATISTSSLVFKHIELIGTTSSSPTNVEAVYDLIAKGLLEHEIHTIGFDEIADGLARLDKGEVTGRLVALL